MNPPESKSSVRYIASIKNVKEVILSGTADYGFWRAHFNSSPLLSFAERAFFETPYQHSIIHVENNSPAYFEVRNQQGIVFQAQMSGQDACVQSGDEMWEGAIFLPGNSPAVNPAKKLFYARLGGNTDTYPYLPTADRLEINTARKTPGFQWLIESNFAGKEWHLRSSATHERSKTYRLAHEG